MKWFEGSIREAVITSKTKKAIFVVFVAGNDDVSETVAKNIESAEISSRLERKDFVAVRIESGSETYTHFVQIYHLVPVPSIFFIGESGSPLEIIAEFSGIPELAAKIDTILQKAEKHVSKSSSTSTQSERKSTDKDNEVIATGRSDNPSGIRRERSQSVDRNSFKQSYEEKVKETQPFPKKQKKDAPEEGVKKEAEEEKERRKKERELHEFRLKQRDLEVKLALEERLKEKAEDAAAKEKIKQQIAQDRLLRKEREQAMQKQKTSSQQESPKVCEKSPANVSSGEISLARIQFRLPSGKTYMGEFESTRTLGHLRTYIIDNIEVPFREYTISTSFPKKNLSRENDNKTLVELGLIPTAVILISPLITFNSQSVTLSSGDLSFLSRIFRSLLTPFIEIINYVTRYFRGDVNLGAQHQEAADSNESRNTVPQASDMEQNTGVRRRNIGFSEARVVRDRGNVHRLRSENDDDDENNTWNGNSTQQM